MAISTDVARRALLCAGVLVPSLSTAADIQVAVDAGVGISNNINRTLADESSGIMESAGLRFAAESAGPRLSADIVGDLTWFRFASGSYSSQFSGTATGRMVLDAIENHLQWTVEDNFGQTRRDLLAVPSPDNTENVNFMSTGPDLRLNLGSFLDIVAGGRLTLVDYEDSPADTRRLGAWAGVERELPRMARIGAHVTHELIKPRQDASFPAYDRSTAFASLAITGAHTRLSFDAGANRVDVENAITTGFMARVLFDREFGEYAHLTLRVGRELTDSGESLSLSPGLLLVQDQQAGSLVQEAQPFINQYASAAWYMAGTRTTINLYGGWYDENYQYTSVLDRQRLQLGVGVMRDFAVRMQFRAGADYGRDQYDSPLLADNINMTARIGASWSPFRKAGMDVTLERNLYQSQESVGSSVNETRLWIHLRYGTEPDRTPRLR